MASSEVEFLEERLALLETWLESTKDDDNNEDLIQKREEYRGLIEETVLLQKKLRKTSKLLSTVSNEKTLQKLSKKQDQYICEIEEIMNYAESDVLFETSEIEPNELLGEPLETLMEQPGLEGSSSSLNFSIADFMPKLARASQPSSSDHPTGEDLHPIAESTGTSSYANYNESMESVSTGLSTLFTISTSNSSTLNHDEKTLRKKLKKVEKLLKAEEMTYSNSETSPMNDIEIKKLMKKREQYIQTLEEKFFNGDSSTLKENDNNRFQGFDSLNKCPTRSNENNVINLSVEDAQYQCDLQEENKQTIGEEIEECGEEDKESNAEQFHHSSVSNIMDPDCHLNASYDQKTLKKKLKKVKRMMAVASDAKELELYRQKKKEYKIALETLKGQEVDIEILSPSRNSQYEVVDDAKVASIEGDDKRLSPMCSVVSYSQHEEVSPAENEDQIELFQKKIRKADKSITKAQKEDDPKKLKKIQKKRLEYQASLVELLSHR